MALKVSDGSLTYTVSPNQQGRGPDTQMQPPQTFQDVAALITALPWLRVTDTSVTPNQDMLLATSKIVKIWRDNT